MNRIPVIGQEYSSLTLLAIKTVNHRGKIVLCRCRCGKEVELQYAFIFGTQRQKQAACGTCEAKNRRGLTHGLSKARIYDTWQGMIRRCEDKQFVSYPNYGGRGIKVCPRWHDFYGVPGIVELVEMTVKRLTAARAALQAARPLVAAYDGELYRQDSRKISDRVLAQIDAALEDKP